MIKKKHISMGLFVLAGILFWGIIDLTTTPVKAALRVQVPTDSTNVGPVNSGGFAVPIYNDPECTQLTGQTLSTSYSEWKVNRVAVDTEGTNYAWKAYDLGTDQWVKASDLFNGYLGPNDKSKETYILEAYSAGKKIPIYDSPQLINVTGYLDTGIKDWAVNQYAKYSAAFLPIDRVDLGHNQWVNAHDVDVILSNAFFLEGTPIYNLSGQQTGTLKTLKYKVFGATAINGQTYIKLGDDNQWAKLSDMQNN
ncbi:hypothetical protein ACNAN0_02120 [Agrilactobacillus fermenti]|uniref:hypothetical protein n=1 Tax=Agrilactobacillus fermenti TaxID=2586909 RepID=UPI003A5BB878